MVRIVNGSVVRDEEEGRATSNSALWSADNTSSAVSSSLSGNVNIFGVQLSKRMSLLGGLLVLLWFGLKGLLFLAVAVFIYGKYGERAMSSSSSSSTSSSSASYLRGGNSKGPNVKTIADLPKPPPRGGG